MLGEKPQLSMVLHASCKPEHRQAKQQQRQQEESKGHSAPRTNVLANLANSRSVATRLCPSVVSSRLYICIAHGQRCAFPRGTRCVSVPFLIVVDGQGRWPLIISQPVG